MPTVQGLDLTEIGLTEYYAAKPRYFSDLIQGMSSRQEYTLDTALMQQLVKLGNRFFSPGVQKLMLEQPHNTAKLLSWLSLHRAVPIMGALGNSEFGEVSRIIEAASEDEGNDAMRVFSEAFKIMHYGQALEEVFLDVDRLDRVMRLLEGRSQL